MPPLAAPWRRDRRLPLWPPWPWDGAACCFSPPRRWRWSYLEHAHPGEEEASPPGGPPASSPCAELELAFHDLSEHAGFPVTRAGQAVALLRDLGLADLGKRFSRLSSRRRGAAHPDAPFLADLRRSLEGLDSGFVASTAAAFLEAGRSVQRQADDPQSGCRSGPASHPSSTSTSDSVELGSSEDLEGPYALQSPADPLGGITMPEQQLPTGGDLFKDVRVSGAPSDVVPENLPGDGSTASGFIAVTLEYDKARLDGAALGTTDLASAEDTGSSLSDEGGARPAVTQDLIQDPPTSIESYLDPGKPFFEPLFKAKIQDFPYNLDHVKAMFQTEPPLHLVLPPPGGMLEFVEMPTGRTSALDDEASDTSDHAKDRQRRALVDLQAAIIRARAASRERPKEKRG